MFQLGNPLSNQKTQNETGEKSCAQNQMPHTETNSTDTHTHTKIITRTKSYKKTLKRVRGGENCVEKGGNWMKMRIRRKKEAGSIKESQVIRTLRTQKKTKFVSIQSHNSHISNNS